MRSNWLIVVGSLLWGLACGPAPASAPPAATEEPRSTPPETVFPDTAWTAAPPATLAIDPDVLNGALAYLRTHCGEDGLEEVMIIRYGRVAWTGDSVHRVHDIWSCTKSFTSTAVGLLAAEGKLRLDQPVADHEPRLKARYPTATYRHFLTMTSGYDAVGSTRWPTDTSEDWSWTPYAPAAPLFPPGTAFAYWDEAMIMLGRALTRVAGASLNDYLTPRLFDRIGIERREWWGEGRVTADSLPINFGGTGLRMSAAEQARFGLLYLKDGRWNDERVLPAGWAAAATTVQVRAPVQLAATDRQATDGIGTYGYNWWVIPAAEDHPAAAYTSGLNHNVCLIVPAWDMVIVRMGVDGNPVAGKHAVYTELLRRLAPGIDPK